MSRRMSCSLTTEAVRNRTKTVTRRAADTWTTLRPGDRLTLVEKAMGLRKGERQVVLAEVEIVSNELVPLVDITPEECAREGLPDLSPLAFTEFWADSHHVEFNGWEDFEAYLVRRIEWRYL